MLTKLKQAFYRMIRNTLWAAGDYVNARCVPAPPRSWKGAPSSIRESYDLQETYKAIMATPRRRRRRAA